MRALRLALRGLRRDMRAGELNVLAAALMVAVASVTAVGFFADRVHSALHYHASELLAADLIVESSRPLDAAWADGARDQGLDVARTASFPTMLSAGDSSGLVDVKAVTDGYPLRGRLRTAAGRGAADEPADAGPEPGHAWADARLLDTLDLDTGDTVQLGDATLILERLLTLEPDRGGSLFAPAPRLLVHHGDLDATGLLGPGSRASYRLLVAGPADAVNRYRDWAADRAGGAVEVRSAQEARPEVRAALDRAQRFLGLAALVSVVVAGVAVATGARRYAARHLDTGAIMRCYGAAQNTVAATFLWQVLLAGFGASILGCVIGLGAQALLAATLGEVMGLALPPPSPVPAIYGVLTGLAVLAGFAAPPLMRLREVPPARVMQRQLAPLPPRAWVVYGAAGLAVAVLMLAQARDPILTVHVAAGALAAVVLMAGAGWLLVRGVGAVCRHTRGTWRFGLAGVARRAAGNVVQVVALGVGLCALLILALVRADLLEGWRATVPDDAPNHFLIDIQPDQRDAVAARLRDHGLSGPVLYPIVRGRLVAIDGEPVGPDDYDEPRARRLIGREFNLSWTTELPADNQVVAGDWWGREPGETAQLSVEDGIAERLGIGMGDVLTYRVGDQRFAAEVTSLRAVQWDSFQANFFVLAPPGLLEGFPATYITSLHLAPGERRAVLSDLHEAFPNVTPIDVDAILDQARRIIDRVTAAVEFLFLFTVLAGVVVLYASVQAGQDERRREIAVLQALGARRRQLLAALISEFAALGLVAGAVAAATASGVGWLLARQLFDLPYGFNPLLWAAGLAAGVIVVTGCGLAGTYRVLGRPPLETLNRS